MMFSTVTTPSSAKFSTSTPESPVPSMLDLLYPLSEFLPRSEPRPVAQLEGGLQAMPEPYRSLLVHDSDMTSTLERFYGERLELRLLARRVEDGSLFRQVILCGGQSGKAAEFGAIRIALNAFEEIPRQRILEAKQPLGSILTQFEVAYVSRPRLFFHVESNGHMEEVLRLTAPATLYGRQNVLSTPQGQILAEVVEILPPVGDDDIAPSGH